ncbi:hypothetical protein F5X99DRAFT_396893 [Biscogniauxia marginata]|nr:hypothetical protein F5X99DRAFT_396893 [Biscogniauxia marginata]
MPFHPVHRMFSALGNQLILIMVKRAELSEVRVLFTIDLSSPLAPCAVTLPSFSFSFFGALLITKERALLSSMYIFALGFPDELGTQLGSRVSYGCFGIVYVAIFVPRFFTVFWYRGTQSGPEGSG